MRTICMVQRTIRSLCKPFLQRLIILIVSMLLAISLGSAALIRALPRSETEVALLPSAFLAALEMQDLTPQMRIDGQIFARGMARRTGNHSTGGKQA